jgi:L-lactate dehydrogenase
LTPSARYRADDLRRFAQELLSRTGLADEVASDVAAVHLDGDLLGHSTHGLQLLAAYLREIAAGRMTRAGAPEVVSCHAGSELWDGKRLAGPWLVLRALETAARIARVQGTGTVVIRRSHHFACLAAYLKRATDDGLMMILTCSDSSVCSVAPFGAVTPVFTPNPIAAGIPTSGDPILLDISASLTTNGMTNRLYQEGRKLPHRWVQDHAGNATDDPAVLFREPKGTLLPTGGLDAGHKGFGLALLIEALTAGLAGFGRADPQEGWGATVYVQVLDPARFGGIEAFRRQTDWLADACHAATPRPGGDRVRLPGERGLAMYRKQTAEGVGLYPGIIESLRPFAAELRVEVPAPVGEPPPVRPAGPVS